MTPEEQTRKLAEVLGPIVEQIINVAPQICAVLSAAAKSKTEKDKLN